LGRIKDSQRSLYIGFVFVAITTCFYVKYLEHQYLVLKRDYFFITQPKDTVIGVLNSAKYFNTIEVGESGTYSGDLGFYYAYTFKTVGGKNLKGIGKSKIDLPLNKKENEIPYAVNVIYVLDFPEISKLQLENKSRTYFSQFVWDIGFQVLALGLFILICSFIASHYTNKLKKAFQYYHNYKQYEDL